MQFRLAAAAVIMAIALAACGSQPTSVAHADAEQSAQLEQINATTPKGAGQPYLMPSPASANGKPSADASRYGQALDANPQPPKRQ